MQYSKECMHSISNPALHQLMWWALYCDSSSRIVCIFNIISDEPFLVFIGVKVLVKYFVLSVRNVPLLNFCLVKF